MPGMVSTPTQMILQRVWHEGERISTPRSAGALLYDARELFDQQNAKADEGLRSIVASLPEAVATCVDAAQAELDETRQVALMKVCAHATLKKTPRYRCPQSLSA